MRKHSDAVKKKGKLEKVAADGKTYYAALNKTQIKEAKQLRLTLSEVALQIAEDSTKAEKAVFKLGRQN